MVDILPTAKKWAMEDLPIVPEQWKLKVKKDAAKQFKIIKELAKKADYIINAGDPDREGQLLIDEVLLHIGNKKPVKRILLNALDQKSVVQALGTTTRIISVSATVPSLAAKQIGSSA